MAEVTPIPVTIEPEAAARIAELGMQAEFEQMLEHARQVVPALQRIDVQLALPYDTGDETRIIIQATRNEPFSSGDRTLWNWDAWVIQTFSPDVYRYFTMLVMYETTDAR
jgi:hypothetical protein